MTPKNWMLRWTPWALMAVAGTVGLALGGCPTFTPELENICSLVPLGNPPSNSKYIEVNGRKILYQKAGSAAPKIILIAGLDENVRIWDKVFGPISEFATVVAYDRGGVGWSDRGEDPRTASVIAKEMNDFLIALNVEPPYILCAHSLAGLYARYYASSYPEKIAGLLLIDTSHEDMWRRQALLLGPLQVALSLDMMDLSEGLEGLFQIGALGEYYNIENTTDQVRNERQIPWVPLLLLSQDMDNFTALENDENQPVVTLLFRELYWEQATLSPKGLWQEVQNTSHFIMVDQPQAVIDGLHWVIDQINSGK